MAALRDYIKIKHGFAFKGDHISTIDNGVVLVTPGNFSIGGGFKEDKCKFYDGECPTDYILKSDDLIVTMTDLSKSIDTLGYSAIVPKSKRIYLHNQRIGLVQIIDEEKIDKHYLYWFMRTTYYQKNIAATSSGSTVHHTSPDRIMDVEIELPDVKIQRRVAKLMDNIEEIINTNKQINNNLEQQAKVLYKDWFFDFSPFSTEGNLPNGWRLGTVGDIIQLHDSKRVPLSGSERDKMEKLYPYYGATSLMDYVDNYLFDGIYLLLGEDGTVVDSLGFPILQYVYGQFWVNNHAHIITGKEGFSVEELYLFFSLTNIKSIVTGAVQQKVSQQNLKKVPAIIPSKEVLSAFDDLIQPIFAQIRNLRDENAHLADLRDTLLPRLMSGELDVSDIDL